MMKEDLTLYRVLTPLAAALFLLGGAGALVTTPVMESPPLPGFAYRLVQLALPALLAYALSFSSLGVFGHPALLVAQGYVQAAGAFAGCQEVGFARILLSQWLPGLVAAGCTFSLIVPSFLFSLIRLRQVLGKTSGFCVSRARQLGMLLISLSLLSLCALYCSFFLPRLLS